MRLRKYVVISISIACNTVALMDNALGRMLVYKIPPYDSVDSYPVGSTITL